jgi:BNR repeat-like domain
MTVQTQNLSLSARHVVVYHDPARWAAVPANNGANGPVWQWDDELLVGFTVGTFARAATTHQCTYEQPFHSWLARSADGGMSWRAWYPEGYAGQATASRECAEPADFAGRGFVLRVEGNGYHGNAGSRWFSSNDRGANWNGPYGFGALFEDGELAGMEFTGRTAYLVEDSRSLLLFLSARRLEEGGSLKVAIREKTFVVKTDDGGMSWEFVSWLVPWSDPYRAVMPAPVRLSPSRIVTALRRKSLSNHHWIDCYASADNGASWFHLSRVGDTGSDNGNPPSLVAMADGRLCCVYGNRAERRMLACFSMDGGASWSAPAVLRDDFTSANGSPDLGYARLFQRLDGRLVAVYFWCTRERPETHIEASIFQPDYRPTSNHAPGLQATKIRNTELASFAG